MVAEYLLKTVSEVDRKTPVIDLPDARPFATGNGEHDYLCGGCRNVLLHRVELPRPQQVTMICGKCRTANMLAHLS
jgi:hypothetical protein